ncbi:MAG: thioredoxin-like domain-containing protein [Bacteroidota bacterium]|jgi:thiol-disulfide isomerase/thioredoxin
MKNRYLLLLAVVLLAGVKQLKAYQITFKVKGGANQTYLLGYYYGDKTYIRDSSRTDATGKCVFKGRDTLPGGVYIIASQDKRLLFDFVVNEQEFTMETDTADYIGSMVVKGSPECEAFFAYSKFANEKGKNGMELDRKMKQAKAMNDTAMSNKYLRELKDLQQLMEDYRLNVIKTTPSFLIAKIFRIMQEIDIPESPLGPKGEILDSNFQYNYYKQHYFDGFDFTDDRISRTPVFHPKIENFITKLTLQIPDSINAAADFLIKKTLKSKDISKWCIYWITNHYETSQYMGMDAVFVHMVDEYYTRKEVSHWVDETLRFKITDRANTLRNTLIGIKAQNLVLPDSAMKYQVLYNIEADYTLVLFWDPHCGRCKEEIPKLLTLYKELNPKKTVSKQKKFEIYALGSTTDNAEWRKYIKDNQLPWLNVHDPKHESGYHRLYDINSTPVLYLLNKEKKIIAKRLSVEQLKDFIEKGIQ